MGDDVVAVGDRRRGDQEVVGADGLARRRELCQQAGMDPSDAEVEGQHRDGFEYRLDESLPPDSTSRGIGAMGADQ